MDTEKCKALLVVLECGSLTLAADRLGYTPSGISRMIAALEAETGFELLIRSRRGVLPTAECEKLLPLMRELKHFGEQYHQLSAQIRGLEIGDLTIGNSYRSYYPWLNRLIAEFTQRYPQIRIHIQDGSSSELVHRMHQHQLDLCIISRREGDFTWLPLLENPMVVWMPQDHPLTKADRVPIRAFETESYIDTHPDQETDNARIFKRHGIKPNVRFSSTDNYATYCMVESGLGISLNNGLNAEGWNGRVAIRPLDPPEHVTIGIALPLDDQISPAAGRFVALVKSRFGQMA